MILSSFEFITQWKLYSTEPLERYTPSQLNGQNLQSSTFDFLTRAGLPAGADAFLSFAENDEDTIQDLFTLASLTADYKDYKVIGTSSSGNFICIDTAASDRVIMVVDDGKIEEYFVNTSVEHLAAYLLRFAQFSKHVTVTYGAANYFEADFSGEDYGKLKNDLLKIDPAAIENNTFWSFELKAMTSNCSWARENDE